MKSPQSQQLDGILPGDLPEGLLADLARLPLGDYALFFEWMSMNISTPLRIEDVLQIAARTEPSEKLYMRAELADFVEGVGVAPQGDGHALLETQPEELGVWLVGVEVELCSYSICSQQLGHRPKQMFGDIHPVAPEEAERMGQHLYALLEQPLRDHHKATLYISRISLGQCVHSSHQQVPSIPVLLQQAQFPVPVAFDLKPEPDEGRAQCPHLPAVGPHAVSALGPVATEELGLFYEPAGVLGGDVQMACMFGQDYAG